MPMLHEINFYFQRVFLITQFHTSIFEKYNDTVVRNDFTHIPNDIFT